jgi:hypothetical protein
MSSNAPAGAGLLWRISDGKITAMQSDWARAKALNESATAGTSSLRP